MSDVKSFRFEYRPKDAHTDFMTLTAEEIGVLMQICNLIYLNHAPIENDPKWISQSIRELGPAKCRNIMKSLFENDHIYLVSDGPFKGKICKIMCLKMLKNVEKIRKNKKNFSIIAELLDMRIEELQRDTTMPRNSIRDRDKPPIVPQGGQNKTKGNSNGKRKTKSEREEDAIREAMLASGFDPTIEQDPEHESSTIIHADQSEL